MAMLDALPPSNLTKPARPGDPAPRLRRRPAPLGDRRPRHEPRGFASRLGLAGILRRRRAPHLARQDRLARGRDRPRLDRTRTCPVAALETWLKFARIARGPIFRAVVGREVGSGGAQRPPRRAPGQAPGGRRRRSRRSVRRRPGREVFRAFAARRARLLGRDRRALRPEAPRPRVGGNDPPLPAPPRPLPRQSHQGGGVVIEGIGLHCRAPCPTARSAAVRGPNPLPQPRVGLVDNNSNCCHSLQHEGGIAAPRAPPDCGGCVRRIPDLARAERGIGFGTRLQICVGLCGRRSVLLRYDNEAGKGDHRHIGAVETPYRFTTPDALLADFWKDVETWRPE